MQPAHWPRRPRRLSLLVAFGVCAACAATAGAMVLYTYSNFTPITINDAAGGTPPTPATPYPSNIVVPSVTGNVSGLSVTINGITHTFPDDVDMLLVSPNGSKMVIWSDACGALPVSNIFIVVSDSSPTPIPDAGPCISQSYAPADYGSNTDAFPAPAPGPPYQRPTTNGSATLNGTFAGANSNPTGTWSLYIVDDLSGDSGSITSGWSLNLLGPTAVRIASFLATRVPAGVKLTWRSGSEATLAGFNLYRSAAGSSIRLNRHLILARASGASYSFLDRTAHRGVHYTYRLETVGLDGKRSSRVFATPDR